MRRRGFTWVESLLALAVLCILTAISLTIFQGMMHGHSSAYRTKCQSNIKIIGLAFAQYSQDAGGVFPPIAIKGSTHYGWADLLTPYLQRISAYAPKQGLIGFQCPVEGNVPAGQGTPREGGYTDYWYNARLSSVKLGVVEDTSSTILAGEGNDGTDLTDARYSLRQLPPAWLKQEGSPARRHLDGANYLFADGHAKFMNFKRAPGTKPPDGNLTFAVR